MIIIRVITYLWPFLWELLIGKRVTFKEGVKTKRKQVIFIIITVASVVANIWLAGKVIGISRAHVEVLRENKTLQVALSEAKKPEECEQVVKPLMIATSKPVKNKTNTKNLKPNKNTNLATTQKYERIRKRLKDLHEREELSK